MVLTAALLAMPSACASSHTDAPAQVEPAPVIETRTEVRLHCPAELDAPIGVVPAVPDGAAIDGNVAGLGWLGDVLAWARGLADRLSDARKACP